VNHIPELPADCTIFGSIIEADNPDDLGEDMMDIVLPNGITIHAGWSQGSYMVTSVNDLFFLTPPSHYGSAKETARAIELLVQQFKEMSLLEKVEL